MNYKRQIDNHRKVKIHQFRYIIYLILRTSPFKELQNHNLAASKDRAGRLALNPPMLLLHTLLCEVDECGYPGLIFRDRDRVVPRSIVCFDDWEDVRLDAMDDPPYSSAWWAQSSLSQSKSNSNSSSLAVGYLTSDSCSQEIDVVPQKHQKNVSRRCLGLYLFRQPSFRKSSCKSPPKSAANIPKTPQSEVNLLSVRRADAPLSRDQIALLYSSSLKSYLRVSSPLTTSRQKSPLGLSQWVDESRLSGWKG